MSATIIEEIKSVLNKIEDWDLSTFDFDIPDSKFITENNPVIDIENLIKPPNFNECAELSVGTDGQSIVLNDEQLRQLRKTGTFTVPSLKFEGHNHVWLISKILQSGTDNIKESLYTGLASMCKHLVIHIPKRIYQGKYVTLLNSLKEFGNGLLDIPSQFLGWKHTQKKHPDHVIHAKLSEFIEQSIIDALVMCYQQNNGNKKIIFETSDQIYIGIIVSKYREIIKSLEQPYQNLKNKWNKNQVEQRQKLYNKFNNNELSRKQILKKIANEEIILMQNDILRLIESNLSKTEANYLINLIKSICVVRNKFSEYFQNKNSALKFHSQYLKNINPILSRIPEWLDNQLIKFEKEWSQNHPLDELFATISDELHGQEKYIFDAHLSAKKSLEYANLEMELNNETVPSRIFDYEFNIWNPEYWTVENINGGYHLVKHRKIKNKTSYPGWRIVNVAMGAGKYFNNGCYFLLSNMMFGKFGLRSLFGIEDFHTDYVVNYENGHTTHKYQFATWFGKIVSLWKNISKSRNDFEKKPGTGILSKNITRIINICWNYLFKGLFGTGIIFIGHPLLVLINIIISAIGTLTSPIWSPVIAMVKYLWNIFIYDFDAESNQEFKFFPLLRIIIEKIFIRGFGQFILATSAIAFHLVAAATVAVWTLSTNFIKYLYDYGIYHLILKNRAKIPSNDDFLVRRIAGPGLSSNYYYLIDYRMAILLLEFKMENIQMEIYKQSIIKKINSPRNNLLDFYKEFSIVGLQADHQKDPIKSFTNTKNVLERKLSEIEAEYWKKHCIKGKLSKCNKNIIRMDQTNLSDAIKYGSKLCESIVLNNILPGLNETDKISFWTRKNLNLNDWCGLTIYYYREIFGDSVTVPFEDTDQNGFHLTMVETNFNKFIQNIFDGYNDHDFNVETHDAIIDHNNIPKSNIKIVTPDNILSTEQYEYMLTLNEKYLQNYLQKHGCILSG